MAIGDATLVLAAFATLNRAIEVGGLATLPPRLLQSEVENTKVTLHLDKRDSPRILLHGALDIIANIREALRRSMNS